MDVWLGEEVGQSFVHAIFKAVSHTLSCSLHSKFIAVLMKTVTALCAVRHPVRKGYYYVDTSKYSTASCAPCPHCTFLPAYIRTPVCTGRSDLNDDFLARCKRLWQTHGWVIAHVKGGRANAYPHPRMLDSLSAYRHLVSNP